MRNVTLRYSFTSTLYLMSLIIAIICFFAFLGDALKDGANIK